MEIKAEKVVLPVLIALSVSHFINDLLQSVISASYPLLKAELDLSFTQIGAISLVYQLASSVFQPLVGFAYDKWPNPRSIPVGMCFTLTGLLVLSFAKPVWLICLAVFLVGIGSATLHPEASRITSLAAGGRRGFAQSLFQVGGNLGGSFGPLLVAAVVSVYGRKYIALSCIIAMAGIICTRPICRWYRNYLAGIRSGGRKLAVLGRFADAYGVIAIYRFCCYTPLLGLVAVFLPNLNHKRKQS